MINYFNELPRHYRIIAIIVGVILGLLIAIPLLTYIWFISDLATKEGIMNSNNVGVVLLDDANKPFFTLFQAKTHAVVPLSDIPKSMQQAVIAIEDKEFYEHNGFSLRGIVRSIVENLKREELSQGGSTITQQLVKIAILSPQKSFLRKYQEIFLASEIERRYSKDEILEMYLNSVYFGEGAFGIQSAALTYFGKDAKDLTLAEASLLTGIINSPSRLSPLSNDIKEAKERQQIVLQKMVEQGYITQQQSESTFNTKFTFKSKENDINDIAPHFALMVKDELIKMYGEEYVTRSGLQVKTTLNRAWQEYAERVVENQVNNLRSSKASNGAAVAIDPKTGAIKALVGSHNWYDEKNGKVNMVLAPRQPGSSFKPIVYTKALEEKVVTPATVLKDEPKTFEDGYKPENYDKRFRGQVLVRDALANSLNIPSVEILARLGITRAVDFANDLGIALDKDEYYGLSLVLGSKEVPLLQMTSAYGVFANDGKKVEPTTIYEIHNKRNKQVYSHKVKEESVVSERAAYLISSILSDNQARQPIFGNSLTISRPAAVKTGTTDNYVDAWTIGYTPDLVVGVWVGNNDHSPMGTVAGSLGAAPIWRQMMERFLQGTAVEQFDAPGGLVQASICRENGLLLREATSSARKEYFLPGTEPTQYCYVPRPQPSVDPNASPSPSASGEPTPTPAATATPDATSQPTVAPTPNATTTTDSTIQVTVP
jgi:1A family penicillin-binding protein